jgi:hypothetical protein
VSRPTRLDERNDVWLAVLDARERKEFARAIKRGFLVYRDSQPKLARVWWEWCELARQPHVAIKARHRYGWVMLDMPLGVELSPEALDVARDAVMRHTPHGGWGSAPHAVGHPQVALDRAESLAKQLRDIARDSLHR